MKDIKRIIRTDNADITSKIFGSYDKYLKRIESEFDVRIINKSSEDAFGDSDRKVRELKAAIAGLEEQLSEKAETDRETETQKSCRLFQARQPFPQPFT